MTDHDLIQEARQWTPGMTADYSWRLAGRLADALEAAAARIDQLEKALRETTDASRWLYESLNTILAGTPHRAIGEVRANAEGTICRAECLLAGVPAEPEESSGQPGVATDRRDAGPSISAPPWGPSVPAEPATEEKP